MHHSLLPMGPYLGANRARRLLPIGAAVQCPANRRGHEPIYRGCALPRRHRLLLTGITELGMCNMSERTNVPTSEPADLGPVFIAGCGRSGTSLLRTAIDAHPDIYIPSESLFITDYLRCGPMMPQWLRGFLLFNEPQLKCWYEQPKFPVHDVADAINRIHCIAARRQGATIWGQKTPRFVRDRALIETAFPGVKWILIYRDPRAVVASMLQSRQHTYSVTTACKRWCRDNTEIARRIKNGDVSESVMLVSYEELVRHFEPTMTKVFEFIGVTPIDKETIQADATPVFFPRSRFPINTIRDGVIPDPDRLDAWERLLTEDQISEVEYRCGEYMDIMGYPHRTTARPPSRWCDRVRRLRDGGIVFRYLRFWPEYPIWFAVRKLVMGVFSLKRRLLRH